MQRMKAGEVDIAAIHDVDGAGFGKKQIERMGVGQLAVRHVNKARNVAAQSSRVCIFTAALDVRKWAHGKTDRHRSMVVESKA